MNKPLEKSLYEQIGGKAAVNAAVDFFYDRLLADPRVNAFFDGVDMERQRAHQKAFMTYAFGGAPGYAGKSMREAHKKLVEEKGLSGTHFVAVAENLQMTLEELRVPPALISQIMATVGSTRDDVLNR